MAVLWRLIELYIEDGRPVGSATLQRAGFGDLSSATIRNYLSALEEEGLLLQEHSSAGRIPTAAAFRWYAEQSYQNSQAEPEEPAFDGIAGSGEQSLLGLFQQMTACLSERTGCASFCMTPRSDQDSILRIHLIRIDRNRLVVVLVSELGLVSSELIVTDRMELPDDLVVLEELLHQRLHGISPPRRPSKEMVRLVEWLFAELMLRQMTRGSGSGQSELYRVGVSRLLAFPEFTSADALAPAIALFESAGILPGLCTESLLEQDICFWLGEDLPVESVIPLDCAVVIAPIFVGARALGAIGVMGPLRLPYGELIGFLRWASRTISDSFSRNFARYRVQCSGQRSPRSVQALPYAGPVRARRPFEDHRHFEDRDESN